MKKFQYYTSVEWRNLRYAAISRDKKCLYCGSTNKLVVHHILPRSEGGRDELQNLITLCCYCHSKEHGNRVGASTIPGPEWEPYRYELTNHADVLAYAEKLETILHINADSLRTAESLRGNNEHRNYELGMEK